MRIVIFASGEGTNFEEIVRATKSPGNGEFEEVEVVGLVCDNPEAPVAQRAASYHIPILCWISPLAESFTTLLEKSRPDLLVLAGFMKILPKEILDKYPAINLHPGRVDLYPELKGKDPQKKALKLELPQTGNVVHWVTNEVDGGEIITKDYVPIFTDDTEESLSLRLKQVGYATLIDALRIINVKWSLHGRKPTLIQTVKEEIEQEEKDFKYPIQYEELKQLNREEELMHLKKNKDYSPCNILSSGEQGIVVRIFDKVLRILNLVGWEVNPKVLQALSGEAMFIYKNKEKVPKNESLEDAYRDLALYSKIAIIFKRGKWGK